jgi:hypothetical protein
VALDFPTSPSVGQTYTSGGIVWQWDGAKWVNSTGLAGAVSSWNTRTGAVVMSSGDVTTALTFTPYNATNPSGYQTAANVTTALAAGQPGAFSTLSASGIVSGIGFSTYLASPPAIGGTAAAAGAFTTLSATSTITPSQTAGIVGTTASNNANAGSVGEYISSNAAPPGASIPINATAQNVVQISLTAGDWDVWATVGFTGAGGLVGQAYWGCITTVSGTIATNPGNGGAMAIAGNFPAGLTNECFPVGRMRLNPASTTTVYLVAQMLGTTGTCQVYGFIGARRVR